MPKYKIVEPNLMAMIDGQMVKLEVGKEYTFEHKLNHRGRAVEVEEEKQVPKTLEVATPSTGRATSAKGAKKGA